MKSPATNEPKSSSAKRSEKESAMKIHALEETNEALKILLERGEDEKETA